MVVSPLSFFFFFLGIFFLMMLMECKSTCPNCSSCCYLFLYLVFVCMFWIFLCLMFLMLILFYVYYHQQKREKVINNRDSVLIHVTYFHQLWSCRTNNNTYFETNEVLSNFNIVVFFLIEELEVVEQFLLLHYFCIDDRELL